MSLITKKYLLYALVGIICIYVYVPAHVFAVLSCSVTSAASCTGTVLLRMSASSNAHAELPTLSNSAYNNNVVCCTAAASLSTSCSGSPTVIVKLASSTNSHVEQNTQNNYATSSCMSTQSTNLSIAYQSNNCAGYDTTLFSISSTTNAHIGDSSAYTIKVCGKETGGAQTLSFTISTTTIYFGNLTTGSPKYASSTNINGDSSEVEAHDIKINTNAASGYALLVQGQTLTHASNLYTIAAIGGTNTASSPGTEQFGIRATASGGTGAVNSPYAASGFAYNANATTSSQLGGNGVGDSATTTYSIRYLSNISNTTESGDYNANIQYIVTANF